jgi:predicted ATPase/DNA-binding winged helix-turn-helix (wHTH) protein/tetratricopeptide (TPR) repeat protein
LPLEKVYLFGPFRLDVAARRLLADGKPVTVHGKAFDVLVALVRRRGDLARTEQVLDEAWAGLAVEPNNVATQVVNLRKILRQYDPATAYIKTETGRGYRFVAEVVAADGADEAAPERHNLPAEANSFVGRAPELREIAARLLRSAALTLIGSGGIGKTRCAIRVGHGQVPAFADGVWLIELAPMADGALVAETLCRVIGAPVTAQRSAVEAAVAFLRRRSALIILDNCEHVLEAASALAAALVRDCPSLRILATSRQALGIPGEVLFHLPPLPLPPAGNEIDAAAALRSDAVRLFVERADAATGGYTLTDADAPAVVRICRRLDGVALATELAAARLRVLNAAEIAARLDDVFRLLTGGSRAALPRQQTLRATIDWSFALLSPQEQLLLQRLAVFVDGFSLPGAIAVGRDEPIQAADVLDLLQALVDKSLVIADRSGPVTRYRMLQTTRDYAYEKLLQSGDGVRPRRMAEYLAGLFARAEATWSTTPTDPWLADFGPEMENLRAAIEWAFGAPGGAESVWAPSGVGSPWAPSGAGSVWAPSGAGSVWAPSGAGSPWAPSGAGSPGDPALGIALVAAGGGIAEEMSLQADMRRWTAAAAPHLTADIPPRQVAWVLFWTCHNQATFGVGEVSAERRRMIALFREANDIVGLSCALRTTGISIARPGAEGAAALAMLTEAVELLRPLGMTKDLASALAHLGSFHYLNGDIELAWSYNEEALAMRRALGDRRGISVSYINMGEFAFVRGDTAAALRHAADAVALARRHGLLEALGTALSNQANYLLAIDDLAAARAAAAEALILLRALGNHDHAALCLEHLALERALGGDAVTAALLFGHADAYLARTGQHREPSERIRADRLRREIDTLLGPARVAALMRQGAQFDAAQADATALQEQRAQVVPIGLEATLDT